MIWKQFTHLEHFPPKLKSRFNSFLTTEFDDSVSVEMQLRSVIKWCQGNFKTVDTLIDFINDISNWLKQFENNFDTKLEGSVSSVLSEWQTSGKLDDIINDVLQWQLDDYIATNEQDKLSLTAQLQQTNEQNYTTHKKGLTDIDTINISTDDTEIPIITFIDDDGSSEVYDRLYPVFQSKGEKFVSAICPNLLGKQAFATSCMTEQQVKELHDNGHEIINHNWNHGVYATVGETVWEEEIRLSKEWLYKNGYTHDIYVNPQGTGTSGDALKIMRKYSKCAFNKVGQNSSVELDTFNIKREGFGSFIAGQSSNYGETLDYYKAKVDECLANNTWLVWMVHVWNQDVEQDVILADLIDYIQSLGIEIVTASEGFRRKANRLEIGDNVLIDRKGSYDFGAKYLVDANENIRTNDDSITGYQNGKITISTISLNHANGVGNFPFKAGGVLTTNRIAGGDYPGYHHQYFESYIKTELWQRSWNAVSNVWNVWERIHPTDLVVMKGNATNGNSLGFGTIPGHSSVTKTYTVTGIGFGMGVIANPKGTIPDGLIYNCWISGADTLSFKVANVTASDLSFNRNWDFKIIKLD